MLIDHLFAKQKLDNIVYQTVPRRNHTWRCRPLAGQRVWPSSLPSSFALAEAAETVRQPTPTLSSPPIRSASGIDYKTVMQSPVAPQ